jgi:hypothetical protein
VAGRRKMMLQRVIVHAAASVLVAAGIAEAQKPPKCSDIPISVQVLEFDADGDGDNDSALFGDSKGPTYTDGVDGVTNTAIYVCSGTYDATMRLGPLTRSKRSLGFAFPEPNAGSVVYGPAPEWAGTAFLAKPFMNIRNILWGRMQAVPQLMFTTRIGFSYISGPADKATYKLQFAPTGVQSGVPGNPAANDPDETTAATVQDIPGDCRNGGTTLDTWIVTVNPPAVGALMRDLSNGAEIHSGQYSMPFKLLITAQRCLPF